MIPQTNDNLINDIQFEEIPTNTFKLDMLKNTISGFSKELEAMVQAVYLILNIERYEYLIYSWNYGIELQDLFGQPPSFAIPEIKRRITEALLQDERITAVENFTFEQSKGKVSTTFTVKTIYGEFEAEKVVNV